MPAVPTITNGSNPRNGFVKPMEFESNRINGNCRSEESAVPDDWLLWQLADSAFPTGGFAHSGGLEAAAQHGEVRDPAGLENFLATSLRQVGRGSLPFMLAAYDTPAMLEELDDLSDSFLTNHVANRASRLQGKGLLASAIRIFGPVRLEAEARAARAPVCGHLAPVFGIVARALKLERARTARLFLFWHLRGWMAGAVRLGLAGPMEAQALQNNLGLKAERVLDDFAGLKVNDVAQIAPMLDLWQAAQDRLYSRLFQS